MFTRITHNKIFILLFCLALFVLGAFAVSSFGVPLTTLSPPVTPIYASTTGAASSLTCTLTAPSGKMLWIEGFDVYGTGATAASSINVTVTGLGTTLNYSLGIPGTATTDLGTSRLAVRFPSPIPAAALGTNIVVNVPSFGAGNTQAACTAFGFTQ
jgi:hypothetical protein